MSKKFKINLPSIIVTVITSLFVTGVLVVYANWTAPTTVSPGCPAGQPGCDAPVNVGPSTQLKLGALGVSGIFQAFSDAFFSGNVGINQTALGAKLVVNNPTTAFKVGRSSDAIYAYSNNPNGAAIHAEQGDTVIAGNAYAALFKGPVKVIEGGSGRASLQKTLAGAPRQEVATISPMYDLSCTGVCNRVGQDCVLALHMVGQATWNEAVAPTITTCGNNNTTNPRRCVCY